jgi:hypothetical protein
MGVRREGSRGGRGVESIVATTSRHSNELGAESSKQHRADLEMMHSVRSWPS